MSRIIYVTREELLNKREVLLNKVGCSLEEWNRKVSVDEIQGEEWDVRSELSGIAFLLGE